MRVHAFLFLIILWPASSVTANEPLAMAVSPVQSFAPTNLSVRIRVVPDESNRVLEVVAESDEYYSSSQVQLDGAEAPRSISLGFRNLPGGSYEVRSTLLNSAGHQRGMVQQHVIVIEPTDSE